MASSPLKSYVNWISSKLSTNFFSDTGNNLQIKKTLIAHSQKFMWA
jgi:hypothetical protein